MAFLIQTVLAIAAALLLRDCVAHSSLFPPASGNAVAYFFRGLSFDGGLRIPACASAWQGRTSERPIRAVLA